MYIILLALMVPAASGLVDCRAACRSCREKKEPPSMVEVYCSMCEECKKERRAKLRIGESPTTTHLVETVITISIAPEKTVQLEKVAPSTSEPIHSTPTTDHILERMRKEFATAKRYPSYGLSSYDDDHYDYGRPLLLRQGRLKGGKRLRQRGHQPQEHQYQLEDEYQVEHRDRLPLPSGVLDIPEGCPTPPDCSYEISCEDQTTTPTTEQTRTTTAKTTTMRTTTTTRKPCPPIKQCRKRKRRPRRPCGMPCMMPICPCPVQIMCPGKQCANQPSFQPTVTASVNDAEVSVPQGLTTQSNDYYYMYVGVPKNVIKH